MIIVTEAQSAACVTHDLAFDAMRRAFIAAIGGGGFQLSCGLGPWQRSAKLVYHQIISGG